MIVHPLRPCGAGEPSGGRVVDVVVAEFLGLERVKPNTLGTIRMLHVL